MRLSKIIPATLRNDPQEAKVPSHRLLLRAGFIRQIAGGVYIYGPLAKKVLLKIEGIVRQEMNRAGAYEVDLPIIQPKNIWEETGRWNKYLDSGNFFTTKDRNGGEYCLAPTAEEAITWLIREGVTSWKQLPVNYYQIGRKFRNEQRPRFGPIRCREFVMKDAYSFDIHEAGMKDSYAAMRAAYIKIFTACGLRYRMVEADSGAIGGTGSAEFMALSETGEDFILTCSACDYAANQEKAVSIWGKNNPDVEQKKASLEDTPNARTVEQLCEFFQMTAAQMVKTIIYKADGEPVAVCIRGDQEINEIKLGNALGCLKLELADDETVKTVTKAEVGFAGPIGLDQKYRILFDQTTKGLRNFLCGGNSTDKHWINVNFGPDLPEPENFVDVRKARAGEPCGKCENGQLEITKGIETGHIFQLGTSYSEKMNACYTDEKGEKQVIWMGCYGIGVSRIMSAVIEQNFDDKGIIWPESIAPMTAIIIPTTDENLELAEKLHAECGSDEFLLDDRKELRTGVRFNDADLLGIPYQIIIGKKASEKIAEIKQRKTGERREVTFDNLKSFSSSDLSTLFNGPKG